MNKSIFYVFNLISTYYELLKNISPDLSPIPTFFFFSFLVCPLRWLSMKLPTHLLCVFTFYCEIAPPCVFFQSISFLLLDCKIVIRHGKYSSKVNYSSKVLIGDFSNITIWQLSFAPNNEKGFLDRTCTITWSSSDFRI